jgi:hypothetical protein
MKPTLTALILLVSLPTMAEANMTGHFRGTATLTCPSNAYRSTVGSSEARVLQDSDGAVAGRQLLTGSLAFTVGSTDNTFTGSVYFDTRFAANEVLYCSNPNSVTSTGDSYGEACGSFRNGIAVFELIPNMLMGGGRASFSASEAYVQPAGDLTVRMYGNALDFEVPVRVYRTACTLSARLWPLFP